MVYAFANQILMPPVPDAAALKERLGADTLKSILFFYLLLLFMSVIFVGGLCFGVWINSRH